MKPFLPALVVLAGAACGAEPGVVASRASVTNASDDAADLAVVGILPGPMTDAVDCTGTLVAPRVVLTAAHCLRGEDALAYFGAAPQGGAGDPTIPVVHARRHPDYDHVARSFDVAVLLLAEPSPVPPLPMAVALPPSLVGGAARLVGFGRDGADDLSPIRKRTGTARVDALETIDLRLGADPSLACEGDSGGPVLVSLDGVEVLAGVVSGGDPECASFTRATRVDVVTDFVAAFVAATADGSAGPGERCFYPAHCATGTCLAALDEPGLSFCSTTCTVAEDCACDDAACATLVCEGGQCRPRTPSPGALGSTCAEDADCLDELCTGGACSVRCFTDVPASCPDGFACRPDPRSAGEHACFVEAADEGCSCRVGSGRRSAGGGAALLLAAGLALLGARRRQRQASSSPGI